jgi:hypothetical protein
VCVCVFFFFWFSFQFFVVIFFNFKKITKIIRIYTRTQKKIQILPNVLCLRSDPIFFFTSWRLLVCQWVYKRIAWGVIMLLGLHKSKEKKSYYIGGIGFSNRPGVCTYIDFVLSIYSKGQALCWKPPKCIENNHTKHALLI